MKYRISLALIATFCVTTTTQAAETVVSHFDTVSGLTVAKVDRHSADVAEKPGVLADLNLAFEALGQHFDLRLQPNRRIVDALSEQAIADGVRAYRGQLVGKPDSWARIVMFAGEPRGVIWDGETMFAIEAPGDSAVDSTSTVIYRLDDLYIAPATMTCGGQPLAGNARAAFAKVQRELQETAAQAPGAVSEITMSVIGDYELTVFHGSSAAAAAAITARFNNVDGYYSEQVGVQLTVQLIETYDDDTDAFSTTLEPSTLLDELSEYRLQTSAHNSRGLTHLYTGRDFPTSTVGIAWRGALCNDYFSAGLSEGLSGLLIDSLVAAHEIGHNFGAQHDGEPGSSCESEPEDFIMAAAVTGREEFSDCSIGVMQAEAAGASCVTTLAAVDVSVREISAVSSVLLGASTSIEFEVSSNGTDSASGVVADFVVPSTLSIGSVTSTTGSCTSGAGSVSCALGDLPGLSNHAVTIATTPVNVGVGMMSASVSTTGADERAANNQVSSQVTVDPAVDLVVNTPSTAPVFVDNSTTVTATLENLTSIAATDVSLTVTVDSGLQIDSATWTIGTCAINAQQIDCQAPSFDGQSSSTLTIAATAVATGAQDVAVTLSSPEADANPGNNSGSGTVNVVTPNDPGDDDSGGGGTTGPLLLLLLLMAGLRGRRFPRD